MSNKVFRIIDANINRAMEGIRVVEDIVRFELDDKIITSKLKNLRSDLKKAVSSLGISSYELLRARSSRKDVGADLYSAGEGERAGINEIITSNFKRVEESLRVLEESVKLLDSKFGKVFKALRYKVYALEQELSAYRLPLTACRFPDPCLYVIVDPEHSLGRPLEVIIKAAIKGGAKIIQLRDKNASKRRFLLEARKIARICKASGVTFIVNDHVDIAKAVDADGVHLGQDDVPVSLARSILGPGKIIGASASNLAQAIKAEKDGADYVGVGPVYSTSIKTGGRPVGIKLLKRITRRVKIPIVAIGGINESNVYNVRKAGVKRAAVIRAVAQAKDIRKAVKGLVDKFRG